MRAEVLSCGTELLLGHISDTNATYLAQSLAAQGIDLFFVSQVGDNLGRIVETLERAWNRSDLVVMTGGLGPTEDDLTREAISSLMGETMQVDPELEANLRAMFATRHYQMPERNLKQATLIPSAQSLPNPVGTAPGWFVQRDNKIIVAMPGVPREMHRMWEQEAIPRLSSYTGGQIFTRLLRVSGMGESNVEEALGELLHSDNPTIATYAKSDAVDVRVTAKAQTHEQAEQQVAEMEILVRQVLKHHIFGVNKQTLQSVVGDLLTAGKWTISVMESLTGGLLSSTLTDAAGSSTYFRGGVVSYSTDLKEEMGVPHKILEQHGAVSEETARAMAQKIRERFETTFGVGITGVAGPDTQEGKPVGTVYIAISTPEGFVTSMGPGWRGSREDQKRVSVLWALNLLRLYLEGVKTARA